ncbi:hypothetical protein ABEB36_007596 [Hypothenemus hampei]|uniref:Large ribosomal subunit protein mL44 n=1 Tax=Hypothenemus hampei TaxID=57062 RepID=A0ABD1EUJ1_HYPHA
MSFWRQSLKLANRLISHNSKSIFHATNSRNFHRWVSPTLRELSRRRKIVGPDPEKPRSTYLEWNYDVEIHCFGKRVGENFDEKVLREAFIQREWANLQEFKGKAEDESFIPPQHNYELVQEGFKLIKDHIQDIYSKTYTIDIVNAVCDYLTTDEMLAHVAKYLGVKDLIKSVEFPPSTKTLADTFKAIVGALSYSADPERVKLFVNDFVVCQMNGKDVYDIWTPDNPYDYLLKLLQEKGITNVEPRLCNQSATNTILANYQVGLYNSEDKSCLGLGWGENIQIAKNSAALDAIQRIYN